jgi:hypothetical protein
MLFKRRTKLKYIGRSDLVYLRKDGRKLKLNYEIMVDMVCIYFGGINTWHDGIPMTEDDRANVKKDIEELAPNHWNIAWSTAPTSGW